MDTLAVCRVCLTENIKMRDIVDSTLQEIYEKLADTKIDMNDGKPARLCYMCLAQLRSCSRFTQAVRRSEMLLAGLHQSGAVFTQDLFKMIKLPQVHSYSKTPMENFDILDGDNMVEAENIKEGIKIEFDGICEEKVDANDKENVAASDNESVNDDPDDADGGFDNLEQQTDSDDEVPLNSLKPTEGDKLEHKKRKYRKRRKLDASEVLLTKEQQLQDIASRATSLNYLNSPFRCTLCYKGFVSYAAYTNHQAKHDEDFEVLPIIEGEEVTREFVEASARGYPSSVFEASEEDTGSTSSAMEKPDSTSNSILIKLLKDDLESSSLLVGVGNCLQGDAARNLLSFVIAKEILRTGGKATVEIYQKWCAEIKRVFPKERISTYYMPVSVDSRRGVTHQARGKLVNQVMNTRRKYQKLGVLGKAKGRLKGERSPSSTISRLVSVDYSDDDIDVGKEIQWLKSRPGPWSTVEEKWKGTVRYRLEHLRNISVDDYMAEFPALKNPRGYILLQSDFDAAYPQLSNNLHINFPVMKPKLLQKLVEKNTKDSFYQGLAALANSDDEETTNIAAFLTLPLLIPSSAIYTPTKKKTGKEKVWRPTKVETRECFIAHIIDDSGLRATIDNRYTSYSQKGLPVPPYIVIVGPTLSDIKYYFVVINSEVYYNRGDIMSAVDTCFKAIWALNLEYSVDCYGVWYFIQKAFYDLTSSRDKGSICAESLMTDCM